MAGGNLGKFSEILFQISGPMFALSSVIQLLTGEKIVNNLRKIGLLRFGAAAIAIGAFIIATNLINKAREKERMAIEGLANAVTTTKTKLETLGGFFNVTPTSRAGSNAVLTSIQTKPNERSQIQALKKTEDFQKNFEKDIAALSQATNEEALLALQTLALDLRGQGFAKAQVDIIIKALLEESKKSKLILEFSQLDLSKEEGRASAIQLAQDITKNFNTEFEKGVKKTRTVIAAGKGGAVLGPEQLRLTTEQQKQLKLGSQELSNVLAGVTGQFKAGIMGGSEYSETMKQILASTENTAYGNMLLKQTLIAVNPEYAKATAGVKDYETRLLILQGALLEVEFAQELVLKAINGSVYEREAARAEMKKLLAQTQEERIEAIKAARAAENAGKIEVNALQKMIDEIKNQTKAFGILIKKRVEYKQALELSNNAEIANLLILAKKNGTLPKTIALVKELNRVTKLQEAAQLKALPADEKKLLELDYLKKQVDLREAIIDAQFAPQIKKENDALSAQEEKLKGINKQIEDVRRKQIEPIQNLIDSNNYALQVIALQEDAINEKYNKEIEALDKIEKANQNIANIQKQRMSIADALTRGDISAAAQAVQEARAERAQSALTGQRDVLTRARDERIEALGRIQLEKQNKELQLQIATIENNQLKTLELQKTTIENTIAGHTANITALNTQVDQLKESYKYGLYTKLEIQSLEGLITKAKDAGILFTAELLKQADAAERLAAALAAQQAKGRSFAELQAGLKGGTISKGSITEVENKTILEGLRGIVSKTIAGTKAIQDSLNKTIQRRMYGGAILPQSKGGMGIVKNMAFGGRAVGSDTVPAMLTPGEFVMNKAASKAYGPLLERINESKYPSMLGRGGMTQIPVNNISTSMNDNSTAVYNYNLGFSINGSNGSAKDIANAVMREIKNVDSQRIRGQRR
jgi:hypothetical protein